jgi:NAD(P)H dehydrogenase (quinone)
MYAILGASGKAGRATVEKLRAQGESVRAVVRESSNTADLEALGCEMAFADLHDTDAISKAIEGATAVQVICPVTPRAKDALTDMENIIDAVDILLSMWLQLSAKYWGGKSSPRNSRKRIGYRR